METHRIRNSPLDRHTLVLLDTSFLLTALKQHLEFDEQIRGLVEGPMIIATLDRIVFELQRLARTGSSQRRGLARVALGLVKPARIQVLETVFGLPDVDTSIVTFAMARREPVIVATLDRRLRELLSKHRIPTIHPRGRRRLMASMIRL